MITVVVPLSAFLRFIAGLFFNSFRALTSLRGRLFLGSVIKGESMRLLRTNSSKTTFEESLVKFKQRLRTRGYPKTVIERSISGVNFAARPAALTQKKKASERILPFVTTYHPAVSNLKQTLMEQWSLIQNQPLLKTIYLKPPIISYKEVNL